MDTKNNVVGWFELPVTDMERALAFYGAVLGIAFERHTMNEVDMAWFPFVSEGRGAGGALVLHKEWYKPSVDGALLYFSSPSGDLSNELARVEAAGGKILVPRKEIAPTFGYMAVLTDTEGNRVALHSME